MKTYVVATVNFFDNEIKQSIQKKENKFEAFKSHMLDLCRNEESKQAELEWQQSEEYPKTFEELIERGIGDWEMDMSVIEIPND